MSNSPLVAYTKISPNKTVGRNSAIDRISPHCVVGQCSIETLGNIFAPTSVQASSNYGIGYDGRVGMYVEEKDRSWCTSSSANDNRAVTIECASDTTHPYAMKSVVYEKLIELCVDICKRNGKTKLLWFGDKTKTLNYKPASNEMVITVHRWFANKSCPGDWLYSRLGDLAEKVTAQLNHVVETPKEPEKPVESNVIYRVQAGAYSHVANAVNLQRKLKAAGFDTYLVKADDGLYKVQTGAFKNYDNAYNLVQKLSNAGFAAFITTKSGKAVNENSIDEPKEVILKNGDKVKMQNGAPVYGKSYGFQSFVYNSVLYVREINGDVVIVSTVATGAITGAVHKKYLTKI